MKDEEKQSSAPSNESESEPETDASESLSASSVGEQVATTSSFFLERGGQISEEESSSDEQEKVPDSENDKEMTKEPYGRRQQSGGSFPQKKSSVMKPKPQKPFGRGGAKSSANSQRNMNRPREQKNIENRGEHSNFAFMVA